MPKQQYGFVCGDFSVALSGNGVVMPGSKNQPLRASLVPGAQLNDLAGAYNLSIKNDGRLVCDVPVHALWIEHPTQREPFLGFKADNAEELRLALAVYQGKRVEITLTPLEQTSK